MDPQRKRARTSVPLCADLADIVLDYQRPRELTPVQQIDMDAHNDDLFTEATECLVKYQENDLRRRMDVFLHNMFPLSEGRALQDAEERAEDILDMSLDYVERIIYKGFAEDTDFADDLAFSAIPRPKIWEVIRIVREHRLSEDTLLNSSLGVDEEMSFHRMEWERDLKSQSL